MEPLPDLATLTDTDLKGLIDEYTKEEQEVSYRRRILHGKIDILRAELVARLQKTRGPQRPRPGRRRVADGDPRREGVSSERMSHIYCPECGFQNPEAANYCAKCGALLHERESESVEQTQSFTAEEREELLETLGDIGVEGPALVVRSGGGRAGETLRAAGRAHHDRALARLRDLPRRRDRLAQARRARRSATAAGSSRTRGASTARSSTASASRRAQLDDGDELQIGKYRLTFLKR